MDQPLSEKRDRAVDVLRAARSAIVALSGGVDSAVLLALAVEALGRDRVLAVTAISPSLAEEDQRDAKLVAAKLGALHLEVATRELERPEYRANLGDRCYHCRAALFETLESIARERGFASVVYGALAEDAADFRPGMRAATEHNVLAPLMDSGLTKKEVRVLAEQFGLPILDKPAAACLSSRIPIGTEVTPERLAQVGRAEAALRSLGFRQVRVRHHGEIARLEIDSVGFRLLVDDEARRRVVDAVLAQGFRFVALDLEGYRTGSLNPVEAGGIHRIGPNRDSGQ
jgi:uncharacterized protein